MRRKGAGGELPAEDRREPGGSDRADLDFHYSRAERLSLAGAPKGAKAQGFFRRHRSLLIILADIAILLVLGLLALRFFGPPDSSARLGPYGAALRGLRYGEVVFATVTVRLAGPTEPGGGGEAGAQRVYARFALGPSASDAESFFDSAPLPEAVGQEVVLQAALPFEEGAVRVYAEVTASGRSARMSLPRSAW